MKSVSIFVRVRVSSVGGHDMRCSKWTVIRDGSMDRSTPKRDSGRASMDDRCCVFQHNEGR